MARKNRSSNTKNTSTTATATIGSTSLQDEATATPAKAAVGGHRSPGSSYNTTSLRDWFIHDLQGPIWVMGCMLGGVFLGFVVGTGSWGILPNEGGAASAWRQNLANGVRSTGTFRFLTFQGKLWDDWLERFAEWAAEVEKDIEAEEYSQNPSHPRVFAVLREAVIREKGGYVHPDLGFLVPAPSGAARGLGMVRDSYHACQIQCMPGLAEEKKEYIKLRREFYRANESQPPIPETPIYKQEEVLIRVPLAIQMTRSVAMQTLTALIPPELHGSRNKLLELDDAALLALLLAHERGVGRYSRFLPYIASMPPEPSCGYSRNMRSLMMDAIHAYRDEVGVDVEGWGIELTKATDYAEKIVTGLDADYGNFITKPDGVTSRDNIEWALCHVASRATAGSEKHGSLRLIPIIDLINHEANAGGFIELTGKEKMKNGDFIDAKEEDSGTFVVRSLRLGRRRALRNQQELLVNYNVPHYSPLDWFVSLGFVPPERWGKWEKIEPVLPKVRTDGPFAEASIPTVELWKEKAPAVLEQLRTAEL